MTDNKGDLCDLDPKNIIDMTSRSIRMLEGKLSGRTSYQVFGRLAMEK
jgi:hypothetical protein